MSRHPRIVTVIGAKGGVGRSVVAANVAVATAVRQRTPVALLDLDWLAGGSLASVLDLEPLTRHWGHWVAGDAALEQLMASHPSGVSLLGAPPPGEAVIPMDQLIRLMYELGERFEDVVIDTSWPHISPLMVPLFDLASVVLAVVTPDITTLQATKHLLGRARDLHFPTDRVAVVLNREGITADISAEDVAGTLKRKLVGRVPYHPAVVSALNRGLPLVTHAPAHPVSQALVGLAERLRQFSPVDMAQRRLSELTVEAVEAARPFPTALPGAVPTVVTPAEPSSQAPVLAMVPKERDQAELREMKVAMHAKLVEQMKLEDIPFERLADPEFKAVLRDQVAERVNRLIDDMGLKLDSRAERA
ncbi:MAG: P-loop NTPase, partial [Candidatus Sericytochromatia bacterium]|nr:P-loop NTPase [Candidatus Sericytochromatia bacterium]